MSPETVLFKSEEKTGRAQAAAFLRQLADKVESGQVVLMQGGEQLTLDVPDGVTLEVKAEEEHKRQQVMRSLEVELEWAEGEQAAPAGGVQLG